MQIQPLNRDYYLDNNLSYKSDTLEIQVFQEEERISNMVEFLTAVQNKQFSEAVETLITETYSKIGDKVFDNLFSTMNENTIINYVKMIIAQSEKEQIEKEQEYYKQTEEKKKEEEENQILQEENKKRESLEIKYLKIEIQSFIQEHSPLILKNNLSSYFQGMNQLAIDSSSLDILKEIQEKIKLKYQELKNNETSFSKALNLFLKENSKKSFWRKESSKEFMKIFIDETHSFTKEEISFLFEIHKNYNITAQQLLDFYLNYKEEI